MVKTYFTELEEIRQYVLFKHNRLLYQPSYSITSDNAEVIKHGALRAKTHKLTSVAEVGELSISSEEGFTHPVVLPLVLRGPLMRFLHDENAHPGASRLLASCQLKYWWRGMTTYVNEYASQCQHCKRRNLSHKVASPPIQRYPGVSRPFQRCHMDLIELPTTPSKFRYILVVKCALTKWVELIPLRSKEAREITEAFFEHIFCRHGSIETMIEVS